MVSPIKIFEKVIGVVLILLGIGLLINGLTGRNGALTFLLVAFRTSLYSSPELWGRFTANLVIALIGWLFYKAGRNLFKNEKPVRKKRSDDPEILDSEVNQSID